MSDDHTEPYWPEATETHRLAKLWEIAVALTRAQPLDVQARILDTGHATDGLSPYRCYHNTGNVIALNLALADGTVVHLGEFHADELDEPFLDDVP